jgi:hypothetical protein
VIGTSLYRPGEWHDFFVAVGSGAAALAGLVFVAMSLNLSVIRESPSHRYRAVGNLTGLASSFLLCDMALMGSQTVQAVGAEVIVVAVMTMSGLIVGFVRARRTGGATNDLRGYRTLGINACFAAQIGGGGLLVAGDAAGLYVVALAMITTFYFMVSGAWLLLIGAHSFET